ncbi:MAG: NUDIX domain-containing protein [Alphaproteobacteria bacterium]|nr:NUDIX domain-containing protein [Alphaproteobacteria bacterium]
MTPSDNSATHFPVSIKGVIVHDGRVVLLRNERQEWELPGGKLELSESPTACLAREIAEELNISVEIDAVLDSWVYAIAPGINVLIVTYGCRVNGLGGMAISHEHKELATFALHDVAELNMPPGYKASIHAWAARLARETA